MTNNPVIRDDRLPIDPGSRKTGIVKWFDDKKAYGFIVLEGVGDVFVHQSNILSDDFRTLVKDETVEFDLWKNSKGLYARRVIRLNPPPE